MKDHIRFDSIQNQGEVVKLYADKTNLHMIYKDIEDSTFYYFTLDKDMMIESVLTLRTGELDVDLNDVFWYNPTPIDTGGVRFYVSTSDARYSFNNHGDLCFENNRYGGSPKELTVSAKFEELFPYITIEHVSSCRDRQFVTGVDNEYHEQVFVEVMSPGESVTDVSRLYYLNSPKGDLVVKTIISDKTDRKVWLGGSITSYNQQGDILNISPYLETFSF